jgi:hypothetical protein
MLKSKQPSSFAELLSAWVAALVLPRPRCAVHAVARTTVRSRRRRSASLFVLSLAAVAWMLSGQPSKADEGGVSFWVPGFFSTLAAAPQVPGFALATIYYHDSVKAGGDVAFARQVTAGNLTTNFTGNLNANLNAKIDLLLALPTYTFAQPFLGGQAQVGLGIPYAPRVRASVDATLTGNLGLGFGGFTIGGSRTDEIDGFGDLIPIFNVRWNNGVHNVMTYVASNITVGRYDPTRLANIGIGHNVIDGGAAYTYLNPQTGFEFSGVLGFTYNFENNHTQYQNGVDMHFDWSASRFVTKELQLGLVGYVYKQLSCDSGSGDRVGCFESQVFGIGPQLGVIIPMGHLQGYLNLKGYKEFDAEHRPSGWNTWLTFSISNAPPSPAPPPKRTLITK